ncbi:MAG: T9SS type A sorting domain-containing protein [Bacteroidaceae bacterium]|nr:T9SS type A sorting domain-containing protein [Bacteroidaceae bacterium]
MKKLFYLFSVIMLILVTPAKAETTPTLIINGETVEKVVTKISFEGDLAVLTFADTSVSSEDMENVILRFSDCATSIKDINAFQLKQAVDGSLNIKGLAEGTQVQIFDASGKQMTATNDATINVSSLKPGMYILKAGSQIVKFVKK